MSVSNANASDRLLRQNVLGSRRPSNYFWGTVTLLGGTGFFLAALSSYLQIDLLVFSDPSQLVFIPQGVAMGFYGALALLLSLYQWLSVLWNVGGGYNEFDRDKQEVRIFRWGFPGKNRQIELVAPFQDVQAVRVEVKEGINPKRSLYLRVKNKRDFPLSAVRQPLPLAELENQGAALARFLGVPLEGL